MSSAVQIQKKETNVFLTGNRPAGDVFPGFFEYNLKDSLCFKAYVYKINNYKTVIIRLNA